MRITNLILVISIMVFFSCSKEENKNIEDLPVPKVMENFNFYKSSSLYNEAKNARSNSYSDAFEIEKAERIGNLLNVTVSYPGNCEINKFDVIWDGIIMESWPMQISLIIKRTASNCSSEIKREILSIDLVELINDQALVDGTVFHVSNASKTADQENSDTVVSNN